MKRALRELFTWAEEDRRVGRHCDWLPALY